MTSGIGGLGSYGSAQFEKMFSRIDTNADGKVSRDEFVAGAPDDLGADKAGALFDKLDQQGAGALSQSDLATAFQQMTAGMQAGMIQAQAGSMGGPPDAAELFDKLDADGDGTVSRDEFVAGRPDDVSEEQAGALFDKLFGEDSEGVDAQTFVAGMRPPSPPSGGQDGDEAYSALDTDGDGVVSRAEFLAARPEGVSEEDAVALFESLAGEDAQSITAEQFAQGMQGPPPPPPADGSQGGLARLDQEEQEVLAKLLAAMQGNDDATAAGTTDSALLQLMSAIDAYTKSQQSASALYGGNAVAALGLSA